jgi:penicillin-binding protein 1A
MPLVSDVAVESPSPRARRRWVRALLAGGLLLGSVAVALGLWARRLYEGVCSRPCADPGALRPFAPNQTSYVLDVHGRVVGRFLIEDRRVAPLSSMPLHLRQAFLAAEDARFYRHDGVDRARVVGAIIANLRAGGPVQGGSTITMQLARNIYPGLLPPRERTLERKLREVRVAREIEEAFPKDTILQHYLNTIYLGHGAYGVTAAARVYLRKELDALTVADAALLAGLPRAPSLIDPYRNPALAEQRRDLVLARMRELGWIRDRVGLEARGQALGLARESTADDLRSSGEVGAYFLESVRLELQRALGPALYRGGFRIQTTLDLALQRTAEQVLEAQLVSLEAGALGARPRPRRADGPAHGARAATSYLQAGLLVLDPDSGDVRVMIGGRSFRESPFNRVTQSYRQPGSAFKPFVYAAALLAGRKATDSVSDAPVAIVMPAGNTWRPENFLRGERNGTVTLETGLAKSLNRATVRLGMQLGVSRVTAAASAMGIETPLPPRPSLLLGAAEVRPLELIAAYAPLARGDGHAVRPRLITRVNDMAGATLYQPPVLTGAGLPPRVAAELRAMLTQVVDRGTARVVRARGIDWPVAGKTGTTNRTTNAWFIGVTPDYVAGVWVGFDRPRPILPDSSATGGRVAAPIWAEVIKRLPRSRGEWPQPVDTAGIPADLPVRLLEGAAALSAPDASPPP